MSKKSFNRLAVRKVDFQYEDPDGNLYVGKAHVTANINFEIEKVEIDGVKAFSESDESIEPEMSIHIIEQLESIAAMKALEKFEMVDFEKEDI